MPLPRFALLVLAATLAGFVLASAAGIDAVWVAAAGALLITLPALRDRRAAPAGLVRAVEPGFLVFVLGLGVVVRAASDHGLADALAAVLPSGASLWALLGVAAIAALLANVVNNLPATLMLLPPLAAGGPAPLLAALVGVNAGPNLTYVGSLATLLWRRVLHAHDHAPDLGEFVRLGAVTVPAILLLSTAALWGAAQLLL